MTLGPCRLVSVIMLYLLFIAGGCHSSTGAAGPEGELSRESRSLDRVRVVTPVRKSISLSTTQPGRVEAYEVTPLVSKITGYIEEILVEMGDDVSEGQTLIRLRVPELHDEVQQHQALLDRAEAEQVVAEAGVRVAEAMVATARSRVQEEDARIGRTEGELARWEAEHARIRRLAEQGTVTTKLADETLSQYRSAQSALEEARAAAQSARSSVLEAEARLVRARGEIDLASARSRVADANLAHARTMLDYTRITAPFPGVITRRTADTGHYVQPAASDDPKPLLVVSRTDKVRVYVDIPESEALLVDVGDPAEVRIRSLVQSDYIGTVARTSWSLDQSNRSLRTEVEVTDATDQLRPGMYATVTLRLQQRGDVLVVPADTIGREGSETFCYCVSEGRVERRPIVLGLRSGIDVEVMEGLTEQDQVILGGLDTLQPGQEVEVSSA
jgi:HlyD family secretion protein